MAVQLQALLAAALSVFYRLASGEGRALVGVRSREALRCSCPHPPCCSSLLGRKSLLGRSAGEDCCLGIASRQRLVRYSLNLRLSASEEKRSQGHGAVEQGSRRGWV